MKKALLAALASTLIIGCSSFPNHEANAKYYKIQETDICFSQTSSETRDQKRTYTFKHLECNSEHSFEPHPLKYSQTNVLISGTLTTPLSSSLVAKWFDDLEYDVISYNIEKGTCTRKQYTPSMTGDEEPTLQAVKCI